jgi:hypothetical protein
MAAGRPCRRCSLGTAPNLMLRAQVFLEHPETLSTPTVFLTARRQSAPATQDGSLLKEH